jgi:hypothetical protein
MEEIRLVVEADDFPVQLDLTFTTRFVPVAADRHRIVQDGEVVTDYLNFFQSGFYNGAIVVDGREYEVRDRAGFRDRGWGVRKHESSGRRGLMVACWCELPDASLYALLYETTSGKQVFTNGWLLNDTGLVDVVTRIDHDLELDGTLLTGGVLHMTLSSGETRTVEMKVVGRNFLSGVGYSLEEELRQPGVSRFDITDPAVVMRLDGQNDNNTVFHVDGVEGHGYVETGVGTHVRYRPQ